MVSPKESEAFTNGYIIGLGDALDIIAEEIEMFRYIKDDDSKTMEERSAASYKISELEIVELRIMGKRDREIEKADRRVKE